MLLCACGRQRERKMVALPYILFLFPVILSRAAVVSAGGGGGASAARDQQTNHRNCHLAGELHEAKLKLANLESALEEVTENVKARDHYIVEGKKQIEDMENKLMHLHSTLSNLKDESLLVAEKISGLEEEVRGLWAVARKNNFDLHVLESQVQEAEHRVEIVTSQAEKMDDIVTEQWIQIQRLEQALEIRIRVSLAQRQAKLLRCTFLKFMHVLSGEWDSNISLKMSALRSYMSQTLNQLKRLFLTVKEFHHELQAFIRQEMERHEFTASLANQELVFFVASALIVFPVLSAWTWLSSKFP